MQFQLNSAAALLVAVTALSACENGMTNPFAGASRSAETFTPITTEEAFRAQVVGREVAYANGATGSYGEDGTWTVTQGDSTLGSGVWNWEGDRWCSAGSTVDGAVPQTCDAVAISDAAIRFTREDGSQGVLPFRS